VKRKIEYCSHLLSVADTLCPGASEMRGYLLWESHGARFRAAQWSWTRMRITTAQYLEELRSLVADLGEVVGILGTWVHYGNK